MTIALPIWQERISPLLDTAARLLVLTCRDGKETGRREIALPVQPPEALARTLAELSLNLLLCGAVSDPLLHALQQEGVRVWPHLCGEVEAILCAFCHGRLARKEFRIPGCRQQHRSDECRHKFRRPAHASAATSLSQQSPPTH